MLDYITSLAHTSHSYLFHEEYSMLMSEEELLLRDSLKEVHEKVKHFKNSDVVEEFETYLKSLGL